MIIISKFYEIRKNLDKGTSAQVALFARVALQRTRLKRPALLFLQMNKSRIQNRYKMRIPSEKQRVGGIAARFDVQTRYHGLC